MTARYAASPASESAGSRQVIAEHPYTASSTAGSRSGMTRWSGTTNGIRASLIRRLARTRRWAMAAGGTANAVAICAASKPSTVCSISGVRTLALIAGWAQTKSSSRRLSGMASGSRWAKGSTTAS